METVRTRCPLCGEIEVPAERFELRWCSHAPASTYTYDCPQCGERVTRRADGRAAQLLISRGVDPTFWHMPREALEEHEGPPISVDDVIDFHIALRGDAGWLGELAAGLPAKLRSTPRGAGRPAVA